MALILIYIATAIGRILLTFLCAVTLYGAILNYKDVDATVFGRIVCIFLGAAAILCFVVAMAI